MVQLSDEIVENAVLLWKIQWALCYLLNGSMGNVGSVQRVVFK